MARSFTGGEFIEQTAPAAHSTVVWWMKSSGGGNMGILRRSQEDLNRAGWICYTSGTALYVTGRDNAASFMLNMDDGDLGNVTNGAWHHIAVQPGNSPGATARLYVDGTLRGTATVGANGVDGTASPYKIGKIGDTFWSPYAGDLAEFANWSVVLTADEIASLAKRASPLLIRPSALVGYTPMVRDVFDVRGVNGAPTLTGTAVAEHPPVIRP